MQALTVASKSGKLQMLVALSGPSQKGEANKMCSPQARPLLGKCDCALLDQQCGNSGMQLFYRSRPGHFVLLYVAKALADPIT
jgi:hypothetical protein